MAYPTAYELSYDFTAFQSGSPTTPLPADKIEIEYNNIATTTDELITAVTAITNSDGSVKNASIGNAQLKSELTIGVNAATTWLTATAYVVHDTVYQGNNVYRCLVAHTSGTFATDLAAGKWSLVLDFNTYLAAASSSASSASASASTATTQATTATTQAGIATAQAVIATTKASEADASAVAAAASAASLGAVLSLTEQGSTQSTPATGISKFYLKTDSNAYVLDDAGTEKVLLKNSAYVANRRGNLFVQNANDDGLEALSQGTSGQVLVSAGADALPIWRSVDVGRVSFFASATLEDDHIAADGAAVSRTTYDILFAKIGTQFGVGDGSTTFNVPDGEGKVIVGRDTSDAVFDTLGELVGSKDAVLVSHTHTTSLETDVVSFSSTGSVLMPAGSGGTPTNISTSSAGESGTNKNIQPSIVLSAQIKYR